jgi:hypothetical protein
MKQEIDKWLEPQRQMQRTIEKWLEPQRVLREEIERWTKPYRSLERQIEKYLYPQVTIQKQIQEMTEPYRRLQDDVRRILEPQLRLQKELKKWLEPQQRLQQKMQDWLEPQRRLQEQIIDFLRSYKDIRSRINELISSQVDIEHSISTALNEVSEDNIVIDQSGTVSINGSSVSPAEFNNLIQEIVDVLEKIPNPIQALKYLASLILKLKKPLAILLSIFIIPFIISVSANLSTNYFEDIIAEISHKPRREQIKGIKKEALETFEVDELSDHLFVKATILNVREQGSIKSRVVAKLYFGQVVKLVKKGRKWSKIEYVDSTSKIEITGWVFDRYLEKFKR